MFSVYGYTSICINKIKLITMFGNTGNELGLLSVDKIRFLFSKSKVYVLYTRLKKKIELKTF